MSARRTRTSQPRSRRESAVSPPTASAGPAGAETALDSTPPLLKLNMTARQQRKLWRHVETIENFWETLSEIEPGVIATAGDDGDGSALGGYFPDEASADGWSDGAGSVTALAGIQRLSGCPASSSSRVLAAVLPPRSTSPSSSTIARRTVWTSSSTRKRVRFSSGERARSSCRWTTRRIGIGVVKTTGECLDILEAVDAPHAENPGVMDRVKRSARIEGTSPRVTRARPAWNPHHASSSPAIGGLVGSARDAAPSRRGLSTVLTATRDQLDLRDQAAVNYWFRANRPEYVFLVAGTVGGILANSTRPAEFIYDNMLIHATVVHAAHLYGVKKLLYLGSSCIYPRDCPQPMQGRVPADRPAGADQRGVRHRQDRGHQALPGTTGRSTAAISSRRCRRTCTAPTTISI